MFIIILVKRQNVKLYEISINVLYTDHFCKQIMTKV